MKTLLKTSVRSEKVKEVYIQSENCEKFPRSPRHLLCMRIHYYACVLLFTMTATPLRLSTGLI